MNIPTPWIAYQSLLKELIHCDHIISTGQGLSPRSSFQRLEGLIRQCLPTQAKDGQIEELYHLDSEIKRIVTGSVWNDAHQQQLQKTIQVAHAKLETIIKTMQEEQETVCTHKRVEALEKIWEKIQQKKQFYDLVVNHALEAVIKKLSEQEECRIAGEATAHNETYIQENYTYIAICILIESYLVQLSNASDKPRQDLLDRAIDWKSYIQERQLLKYVEEKIARAKKSSEWFTSQPKITALSSGFDKVVDLEENRINQPSTGSSSTDLESILQSHLTKFIQENNKEEDFRLFMKQIENTPTYEEIHLVKLAKLCVTNSGREDAVARDCTLYNVASLYLEKGRIEDAIEYAIAIQSDGLFCVTSEEIHEVFLELIEEMGMDKDALLYMFGLTWLNKRQTQEKTDPVRKAINYAYEIENPYLLHMLLLRMRLRMRRDIKNMYPKHLSRLPIELAKAQLQRGWERIEYDKKWASVVATWERDPNSVYLQKMKCNLIEKNIEKRMENFRYAVHWFAWVSRKHIEAALDLFLTYARNSKR